MGICVPALYPVWSSVIARHGIGLRAHRRARSRDCLLPVLDLHLIDPAKAPRVGRAGSTTVDRKRCSTRAQLSLTFSLLLP